MGEEFSLLPMIDFVLGMDYHGVIGLTAQWQIRTYSDRYNGITKYAKFLKQPLQVGQFIPCDLNDNILDKPESFDDWLMCSQNGLEKWFSNDEECQTYLDASNRVLFKGLRIEEGNYLTSVRTFYYINDVRIGVKFDYYEGGMEFKFILYNDNKIIDDIANKYSGFILTETALNQLK